MLTVANPLPPTPLCAYANANPPPPWAPCLAEQGFKASNTARYLHLPASPTQARPLAPRQAAFPLGPRLSALLGVGVHSREQKLRVGVGA